MADPSTVPNALEFLARALPWVLPEGVTSRHYVNVHYRRPFVVDGKQIFDKDGKPRMIYPGRACLSPKEAASAVAWANTFEDGLGTDTYVCMSGQSEATEKTNARGHTYYTAKRSSAGACWHKSFYVDVDVKPDNENKGYRTPVEAGTEFGRIRRAIGLPVPTMVIRSGSGGFHAHWILSEAIPTATWEPIAHALVHALTAQGFRGDTGCTIDAARLLRVPDTWNHKQRLATGNPAARTPVQIATRNDYDYSLEAITKPLEPFKNLVVARSPSVAVKLPLTGVPSPKLALSTVPAQSLSDGITTTGAGPVPIADLAAVCPWIDHTLKTGGRDNSNPLWLASTNIALFTCEGRDAAHWMAQGHPGYTPESTEELWQRQLATKTHRNIGWPQCRNISANGSTHCTGCVHFSANKSPFNHIVRPNPVPPQVTLSAATTGTATATTTTPQPAASASIPMPRGFSYGTHGIITQTITDDDGVQSVVPVCSFPMLRPWMQDHPASINFTTFTAGRMGIDAFERQIRLPLALLYDSKNLAKALAEQHMVIPHGQLSGFITFMTSWIETLRADRDNVVQSAPFGWYRHNGKLSGFIYAKNVWSAGLPRPASNPDPVLERQYHPTGELKPWLVAAKMVTDQDRPQLNAILASAFGAPLVALVGQTGLLMTTYSPESGIGKSTTLRIAQAVWGNPKKAVQSLNDTMNSVVKKIGDIKNLPMYWDELKTQADTNRFVQLAFQLAQGKEKSRMAADTSYREPGTWETLLCATSNDSIMAHITAATKATSAGMARVFEFVVPPGVKGQISAATAQQITAEVDVHYGNAGLMYAQFLGANAARVAREVDDKLHEFEKMYHVKSEERFWLALLTVIVMGAKYANELKLTEINEAGLQAFMVATFQNMRKERAETPVDLSNPASMLGHVARYLNIKRPHNTIVTDMIYTGSGRPPAGAVNMRIDPMNRLDEVQVQFGTTTNTCRLLKAPFVEWLEEQQLSTRIVMQQLKNIFNMKELRGRLGAGTTKATVMELCLEFDYSDPVFRGYIEI